MIAAQATRTTKNEAPRGHHRGAFASKNNAKSWGKRDAKPSSVRLYGVHVLLGILFALCIPRLATLQIVKHASYQALAEGQHMYFENLIPERGEIFVMDKFSDEAYPIATNEQRYFLFAIPTDVDDPEQTGGVLAEIFQLNDEERAQLKERLEKKNEGDLYEPIRHFITRGEKDRIENEIPSGMHFVSEKKRLYPERELAAHVLGFVSIKDDQQIGQYGIEEYYDDILKGEQGHIEAFLDTAGNWITSSKRDIRPAMNGDDIVLTIDRTIQFIVEQELKKGVEEFGAEAGEIVIQDPSTGEIIAMAMYPTFDPNAYGDVENIETFLNTAVQGTYEPGSVLKPFTAAIALNEGVAEPDTTYIDSGEVTLNGWTVKNSDGKAHGMKTLTEVLELSLNTGAIHFQQLAGFDAFERYLRAWGFGEKTNFEVVGEVAGNLQNLENKKSEINYATMSYGQGVSMTPVALISAFSSLINGGILYKPTLIREFRRADGTVVANEPVTVRRVISPDTSTKVSAMLASVVENGHAQKAQVEGYVIGGKTGTANIPDAGGYTSETNHTFLAFAPLDDPQFSILVHYRKPKNVMYAEGSSGVTFQRLAKYLLDYYEIPPSQEKATGEPGATPP